MRAGAAAAAAAILVLSGCRTSSEPLSLAPSTTSASTATTAVVSTSTADALASAPGRYLGSVTVRNRKAVVSTATAVVDLALAKGGIVYTQDVSSLKGARGVVVIKVPHDQLQASFDGLARLGQLTDQRLASDDVASASADLDARVGNAHASVTRLRDFIAKAATANELSGYEAQLTSKETELESLLAEKRMLETRPELVPITVTVIEQSHGVGQSLRAAGRAVLIVLAAMAALAVLAALVALPFLMRRRRRVALRRPVPSPFDGAFPLGPDPEDDRLSPPARSVLDLDDSRDQWPPPVPKDVAVRR